MSAKRLLQNMKAYKLAKNDLDPVQLKSLRKLYGSDEGKVLGSLMTGTTQSSGGAVDPLISKNKRRRRRKRRNKDNVDKPVVSKRQEVNVDTPPLITDSVTANKLVNYSSDSTSDEDGSTKYPKLELPSFIKDDSAIPTSVVTHPHTCTLDSGSDSDTMKRFYYSESTSSSSSSATDEQLLPAVVRPTAVTTGMFSTHICYKCGKIGHLSKDCMVALSAIQTQKLVPQEMKSLFARCRKLKADKNSSCIVCGIHTNLVNCLDCGTTVCDGRGHLVSHLLEHPSHTCLFSYKLSKVIKCCKPSCNVVDCYQLLICSSCFSKIFSQHYSMITATWTVTGLKAISNSLCCDEHFEWHRMNCQNVGDENLISVEKLNSSSTTLSEFIF